MHELSQEMQFFIYLLNRYADYKKQTAPEMLKVWDELGISDLIFKLYPIYHIERLENSFADIDALILEKQGLAAE